MILRECRWMFDGIEAAGFADPQSAQMARRRFRLLDLLCAGSRAPHPGDEHQPELSADQRRWRRGELPRLGHSARPPLPVAEAVVPAAEQRRRSLAGTPAPRHRQRAMAGTRGEEDVGLARAGRRSICRPSASATNRRVSRRKPWTSTPLAWADAINQSGAAYVTDARRPLDGAGLDRRHADRARRRRGLVEAGTGMRRLSEVNG